MFRSGLRALTLSSALCCAFAPAWTAELQSPRLLHTPGLVSDPAAGPGCPPVPPLGPRKPARLVLRDAPRPDVGPYTVTLPGYSSSLTAGAGAGDRYRPFLVEAMPGDTLRFDLVNQLPAASGMADDVNLHTHGLIVSPRRCAPFGDSVYVEVPPGNTARYAITIPATVPGAMFAGGGPDQPYPPGLNWFHAHVHGKARIDVMAGQAGILQIGDLRTTLLAAPSLSPAATETLRATEVVYLGLRDIQLGVSAERPPTSQPATDRRRSGCAAPTTTRPPAGRKPIRRSRWTPPRSPGGASAPIIRSQRGASPIRGRTPYGCSPSTARRTRPSVCSRNAARSGALPISAPT